MRSCLILLLVWAAAAQVPPTDSYARQTWDTENGLPQNSVHAIAQTTDGFMWFGTEGGLARFDSVHFTVFNSHNTPALRSNDIRSLLSDGDGLWIATSDGVALFAADKFQSFTTANGLPSNNVSQLFRNAGNLPCAVSADGIACLRKGRFEPSSSTPPAPLKNFIDREGDVWTGSESEGVTIQRSLEFHTFAEQAEYLNDVVRCIFRDHENTVWAGTNSQGLVCYREGRFSHLTTANGLSSDVIVSLGEDASGDLYVGTPDGLNRIHAGKISVITSADGLPDDFIRSIHASPDGSLWIGTRRGLARMFNGSIQNFTHADGLGSDLVGSMSNDAQGTLWIATLQGLSRFQGGHLANFTTAQGLSSNVITALHLDASGALWVGTQGGGLNRFWNNKFEHFANLGLPAVIYGITEDAAHNLWLASDTGIYSVNPMAPHPEVVAYGTTDGLRVSECSGGGHPGVATLADGSIWFATLKGAAVTQPHAVTNKVAPLVAIETVTIDDRALQPSEIAEVPPGHSRLAFDYAALSFKAPQKVTFRYKLEGFDKDWVNAGRARTAYFTNLGPGSYRFQVMARNEDGIWSEQAASVGFRLLPRFYQTWWFAAAVLAALLLLIYAGYKWRVAQVEAQFNAVLQERNRIAREIHDTLAQGFAGISVQLELVSRKLSSGNESAREHLDQARMLVRSSLSEARRSIWELRSQSAEMEDLAARLSKMVTQMAGSEPGKIKLQVKGTYRPVDSKLEDEIVRIAQEAVTNAMRHADAQHIEVELAYDPKLLHMSISDDGRGFVPGVSTSGVNGHFGLQGMRERAQRVGAAFDVQTAPGKGTKISLEAKVS